MKKDDAKEFILGGTAACGAGLFTNPLEVVKTRMQLQGELKQRGQYMVHYRNSLQALYTIAKTDGPLRLQAVINVKTHLQCQAAEEIAVGTQHSHTSMSRGITMIYTEHGATGLWRGVNAAMVRNSVGSAIQLTAFSSARMYIISLKIFHEDSWLNPLLASIFSGCVLVAGMTPFDVVSTRLYNQPVNAKGEGILYRNSVDCFVKIFRKEGIWGFYKGWGPQFMRLCPHTILSLVFWDRIRFIYKSFQSKS